MLPCCFVLFFPKGFLPSVLQGARSISFGDASVPLGCFPQTPRPSSSAKLPFPLTPNPLSQSMNKVKKHRLFVRLGSRPQNRKHGLVFSSRKTSTSTEGASSSGYDFKVLSRAPFIQGCPPRIPYLDECERSFLLPSQVGGIELLSASFLKPVYLKRRRMWRIVWGKKTRPSSCHKYQASLFLP